MFEPRPETRMTTFFIGAAVYRRVEDETYNCRLCRPCLP